MSQQRESVPLAIFVFDSADAGLIERWADEGYLPTIRGLIERGVWSHIRGSEMISENGIWISLFSGLSRSQHGYFYWRPLRRGTYELELSDQRVGDDAAPFWRHLRNSGKQVAIVDVPETHCTPGLEGVQVANWGPHNPRFEGHSIPESLFTDLSKRFGAPHGVDEQVGCTLDEDLKLYKKLLDQIEQKSAVCRHLLAQGRYDLAVLGFHEAHIAGHQFWRYSAHATDPVDSGGRLTNAIRDVYQKIDGVFGDLLSLLQHSSVMVISNVGLQEDYPSLELTQAFCRQLGYQRMRSQSTPWSRLVRTARHVIPKGWQPAISAMLPDPFHGRMLSREWLGGTDWSATTVFPVPSYFMGFLRVNLRGREPHGVVEAGSDYLQLLDRVEADLKCITDPVTGTPAVRDIARTVDLFHTSPHESLPDIFFDWAPTPHPKHRVIHPNAVLEQKDMFFVRETRHNLHGFFAASGPGFIRGKRIADLSVLDIAPTCMHLLGQPIPESMRGAIATHAFA